MARVSNWKIERFDGEFAKASMERLRAAAEVIAGKARSLCPVGTVSRPVYKRGPYAGKEWTRRDAGALKKTIRVVERVAKAQPGHAMVTVNRNIRVYAGNKTVFYAQIVEYSGKAFLRPALNASKEQIRAILEGK